MAEFNIPREPIDSPPYNAIRTEWPGPSKSANEAVLREALAGVELGAYDDTIVEWLSRWEPTTVAVVCSWLYRAREVSK